MADLLVVPESHGAGVDLNGVERTALWAAPECGMVAAALGLRGVGRVQLDDE